MPEVKVECGCGQKFKFDVEPVRGQMPFAVNCPVCGVDGTPAANAILAQFMPATPTIPEAVMIAPPPIAPPMPIAPMAPLPKSAVGSVIKKAPKSKGEFNMGLGILGALLGAGVGAGAVFALFQWADVHFPFLGVGIGILTGYGAKLLYKGTDVSLGVVSGVIAMVAVVGILYLTYGTFPMLRIISVVVSVSAAYRIASG